MDLTPLFRPGTVINCFCVVLIVFFDASAALLAGCLAIVLGMSAARACSLCVCLLPKCMINTFVYF